MRYREGTQIKINFHEMNKNKCIEMLRHNLFDNPYHGIQGVIEPSGEFELSGTRSFANMYEFKGRIQERDKDIYLVGTIRIKTMVKILSFIGAIIFPLLGLLIAFKFPNQHLMDKVILLTATWCILPWFNIILLVRSNALYDEILKRLL